MRISYRGKVWEAEYVRNHDSFFFREPVTAYGGRERGFRLLDERGGVRGFVKADSEEYKILPSV